MNLKTYISQGGRGTAARLASGLGVSPSFLSQMAKGTAAISPERCVLIEQHTLGVVGRRDLRPQDWHRIWPELANLPAPSGTHPGATTE
ncbi:transcriptional regulator [Cupriavidus sp. SS-3]|uniref:transcriptional regulator n=1 Tax=Cupriavidus sp. SS-3 TaxID=3109596 RepID=UPI002DB9AA23|nr:YdaS family helix-turn-helix protein [Cupriavidus sp. SS-3]MEC3764994.1 YdaS family helix-turn-helix protein [Cupriavidus sp. SS-3]